MFQISLTDSLEVGTLSPPTALRWQIMQFSIKASTKLVDNLATASKHSLSFIPVESGLTSSPCRAISDIDLGGAYVELSPDTLIFSQYEVMERIRGQAPSCLGSNDSLATPPMYVNSLPKI
jgi:hypothetical protein